MTCLVIDDAAQLMVSETRMRLVHLESWIVHYLVTVCVCLHPKCPRTLLWPVNHDHVYQLYILSTLDTSQLLLLEVMISPCLNQFIYVFRVSAFCHFLIKLFMAALCNRAGHYIFALWFLSIFLSCYIFFPRLISAAADWMSNILRHLVWT